MTSYFECTMDTKPIIQTDLLTNLFSIDHSESFGSLSNRIWAKPKKSVKRMKDRGVLFSTPAHSHISHSGGLNGTMHHPQTGHPRPSRRGSERRSGCSGSEDHLGDFREKQRAWSCARPRAYRSVLSCCQTRRSATELPGDPNRWRRPRKPIRGWWRRGHDNSPTSLPESGNRSRRS